MVQLFPRSRPKPGVGPGRKGLLNPISDKDEMLQVPSSVFPTSAHRFLLPCLSVYSISDIGFGDEAKVDLMSHFVTSK